MKLTKSKLKQIIKEELSLIGSLEIEENFLKKNDIQLQEEYEETIDVVWEAHKEALNVIREISRRLTDEDSYKFLVSLKEWFDKNVVLEEVYSEKQRRWACTNPSDLSAEEAEEMCKDIKHSKKKK
jgi:hypothetical protein